MNKFFYDEEEVRSREQWSAFTGFVIGVLCTAATGAMFYFWR